MAARQRQFGTVRRRESGRYQERYRGPDGKLRPAPHTFARKSDAARWLSLKEAEIARGDWINPDAAGVPFRAYADQWITDRVLKARTAELYRGLLRSHLAPAFGAIALADIDEAAIRRWRKERSETGPTAGRPFGPVTVAKAYRLLHAILATATDDRVIPRNPCRIDHGGKEDSPERAMVPLSVAFAIADALPARYRMLVILTAFTGLRWGELVALRRDFIDLEACEIRVTQTTVQLDRGGLRPDTPKSRAGLRTVAFPAKLVPELADHIDRYAERDAHGLVFVGLKGAPLRRTNFRPVWLRACAAANVTGYHFHDLRHTGGTLAAGTGATLKELMARLGHSSSRAAMIYRHATRDRDQAIAKALGQLAQPRPGQRDR